jgi:hypothetical protein
MTGAAFNQLPAQCAGVCELTQENVNKHSIVLGLNCKGPSIAGDAYKESTRVQQGEVIGIDDVEGSSAGRIACTNSGVHLWLKDRQETFREGTI